MGNYPQLPGNDDRDDGNINHAIVPPLSRRGQSEITRYPFFGPSPVPEPETDDVQALLQLLQVSWTHKWLLALSLVTGILAASALTLYMTPVYRATSILEIQSVREVFASVGQASNDASTVSVITEAQVLASKALRERVLSKLNSAAPPPVPRNSEPLSFLRKLLRLRDPAESVTWHEAVAMAGATLDVQPGHDSRIITIQCDSNYPQAAAAFANVLTEEYLQRNQEERWEAYQKTSGWLNRAQQELKAKLEKSEQDLSDFAISEGLILTSDTQNLSEGKLKELQSELGRATANRIEKQSLIDSNVSGRDKSLPEVLDSVPMETFQTRLADLRRQLVELTVTLTPEHYKVKQLQAQIDELEAAKETERSNIIKRMSIQYDAAQKRENALQKSFDAEARFFSTQTQRLIYYNILKREVETNKTLYQTTLEKGKEASLAAAMSSNNAHIVDPALVPRNPFKPSLPFNLALGSIGGLILGTGFVVVRSRSNATIQGPGIFGAQIRVQELGVIPSAKTDPEVRALTRRARSVLRGTVAKTRNRPGSILLKPEIGSPKVTDCLEMVTWIRKRSMVAEAVRATMTSIVMSRRNGVCPKVLLLTSPSPQEGKSTIVSNLGIALAEIGQRVLLIDGDMRLPRLHTIFDVPNTFGLSDILNEPKPLAGEWNDALTRKTSIPGLHVIPAGPVRTNLSRLLHSPRMREFTDRVRETYDFVLIDTAPVLTVPDARILAFSADAVVLVVRAHKTAAASALAAVARFKDDGTSLLGTILNDWNPKVAGNGYYPHYGHYGSDGADTSYYYKGRRRDSRQ